jgi:hypothetical protein
LRSDLLRLTRSDLTRRLVAEFPGRLFGWLIRDLSQGAGDVIAPGPKESC